MFIIQKYGKHNFLLFCMKRVKNLIFNIYTYRTTRIIMNGDGDSRESVARYIR